MRNTLMFTGLVCVLLIGHPAGVSRGDEKAAGPEKSGVTIGQMRIQEVPAATYLYVPAETSFEKMSQPVRAGFEKVFGAVKEAKTLIARPTLLVYEGNPHFHPEKQFKMEIG